MKKLSILFLVIFFNLELTARNIAPIFEVGGKLKSYTTKFVGGGWEVKGETTSGNYFKVMFRRGDQYEKYSGAKCLNWKEVTFE